MKRTLTVAGAALLSSAMALSAAYADNSKEQLLKPGQKAEKSMDKTMGSERSAKELTPGQMEKSGNVDAAKDAAPGQMQKSGKVDSASSVAPGKVKQQTTVKLSADQQTEFRRILTDVDVEPVDVNFSLTVGTVAPEPVVLHTLPPRIVEIVPAYEGYEYFVAADGTIVIVAPETRQIVYVMAG
ncbi:MAG: DUF1236 domain-containing protein [Flavobacteriaceae bacterium]